MVNFANYTQNGAYNAIDDRFNNGAFLARGTDGKVAKGVLFGGLTTDGRVRTNSGLTVAVDPFTAVVSDGGRGAYIGGSDAVQVVSLITPELSNNRVDVLCWRPLESTTVTSTGATTLSTITLADGTSVEKQVINGETYFVKGSPSSSTSPPVPAIPANAVPLGRVYIPGGSTSVSAGNITDMRTWTTVIGGVLHQPGGATDLSTVTDNPPGSLVYDSTNDRLMRIDKDRKRRHLMPDTHTFGGAAVLGATWDGLTPVRTHILRTAFTTNGSGDHWVPITPQFAWGILDVQIQNLDAGFPGTFAVQMNGTQLNQLGIRAHYNGSARANQNCSVSIRITGW